MLCYARCSDARAPAYPKTHGAAILKHYPRCAGAHFSETLLLPAVADARTKRERPPKCPHDTEFRRGCKMATMAGSAPSSSPFCQLNNGGSSRPAAQSSTYLRGERSWLGSQHQATCGTLMAERSLCVAHLSSVSLLHPAGINMVWCCLVPPPGPFCKVPHPIRDTAVGARPDSMPEGL